MDWEEVLNRLSEQISKPSFETWIADTKADIEEGTVIVKANTDFQAAWLESRYKLLIANVVEKIAGKSMDIKIVSKEDGTSIERYSLQNHHKHDPYEQLKSLILAQEAKINELEERVSQIEKSMKVTDLKEFH